ncbi:hypothetical protein BHU72_14700 [Desulfuribacillus stibiiarsenatis]|uniref:Uncharacterized protein n=1 Tax=Desulfuribacillus stibiiarsenatis TaxID=1390249 RepID=A0A1E5L7N8_9FIRM|nr:ATP-binding protein [Desulfuribacillus stibiiarsenatis]OEH85999.1 hypothetical protein BHU72_14700 [Desulfuribacillus stibiiarsenatis]
MWPDYQFSQDNIMVTRRWETKGMLDAWAFYKLERFNYDFAEDEEKHAFRKTMSRIIDNAKSEGQILMLPTVAKADEPIDQWASMSKAYDIGAFVTKYYDRQKKVLRDRYSARYQPYLIVNLYEVEIEDEFNRIANRYTGDNFKDRLINGSKDLWNRYLKTIEGNAWISQADWQEILNKEKSLKNRLSRFCRLDACDQKEIEWLVARNLYKGIGEPKLLSELRDWTIPFEVQDDLYRPTRTLRFLMNGDTEFKNRHVEVKQLAGTAYQMYFTLSEIPTDGLEFPGQEFLYHALQAEYPVDISVKFKPIKDKKVRKKLKNIRLDIDDQEEMSGDSSDDQFNDVQEFESEIKKSSESVMMASFSFGLNSHNLEELQENADNFMSHMETCNVQVVNPFGDQERHFVDFLPCTSLVVAEDFHHCCFPDAIAGGMANASMNVGDPYGIYIGWNGSLGAPVFTQYPLLPSHGMSGGAAAFGPPGSGKSVVMNLKGIETVYHGGRALFFDPKGDRTFWDKAIPGLQGKASVANFGGKEAESDRGKFDPFRLYPDNPMKAMSIFSDSWQFLLDLEAGDMRVTALEESAQLLKEMPMDERNTSALLDRYQDIYKKEQVTKPEYGQLYRQIKAKADHPLVGLLVGNGSEIPFSTDYLLTVIQVHGLSFPDPEAGGNMDLSSEQRISLACFMGIMGFAFKFLEQRDILNFVGLDEIWSISRIPKGKQFVSKLNREGRALKNLVFMATQEPQDLKGLEQYLNNIYIYKQKGTKNAGDACDMLGIPNTEANRSTVLSLEKYHCLFRDQHERVSQVRIEITDPDLLKAFDTTPI